MNTRRIPVLLAALSLSCESGDANKSWSEFSRCMVGDDVGQASLVAARIRSIELSERQPPKAWDAKTQWPGRCEPYANALYSSLGSDTGAKLMKRSLTAQMGCKEDQDPPGCAFAPDGHILPAAVELWEAAAVAGLKVDPNVDVPLPKHDVTLQSADDWKPLGGKGYELADSYVTSKGSLRLLLKGKSGPLMICETAAEGVTCSPLPDDFPKVARQSVKLLADDESIITGLTEEGRKAFATSSGDEVGFRGAEVSARDGVVVEQGEDAQGFLAILMSKGRAKGEAAFEPKLAANTQPKGVGNFATWLEGEGAEMKWVFSSVAGRKLKQAASFTGDFAGYLHPCSAGESTSVGIWGRADGEREAKPTAGGDTGVHASFLVDGEWTKPVSGKIPFSRRLTAHRCGKDQIELFWANSKADELSVGKLTCTPSGCKETTSSWPSFEVGRWLAVGAAGDQVLTLWTTKLGEVRLRVGDPGNFSAAKETVVFESGERGGPVFRNSKNFVTPNGTYMLLDRDGPLLLRVTDSTVTALAP
jgi:hypothetical protein